MLLSLTIRNIALMDEMQVEFDSGLHVFTGETGAGKSILVDSIALLLGGRAQKELIRTGCDKARVEGLFDLADCPAARALLQEQGLAQEDAENELVLAREITAQGRSACRVNGALTPLSQYQQLTGLLMDIHGQHEHQHLMDERQHLAFLDHSGGNEHQALLTETQARCEEWLACRRGLEQLRAQAAQAGERMELLQMRRKELKAARLIPGEEDDLSRERERFRHMEKIEQGLRDAYEAVYDGTEPAAQALREAVNALGPIESLDEAYAALRARLDGLYYEAEDIGLTLRDMLSRLDSDPERLEEIQARLDLLRRLSRKYGGASTAEMARKLQEIEKELAGFESLDEQLEQAARREKALAQAYQQAAARLTASREALARQFERDMDN